jgi:AbiJ N-terminal domain 4
MFEDTFSRRHGYTALPIQSSAGTLTSEAQTRLWNIFYTDFCLANTVQGGGRTIGAASEFLRFMWVNYWPGRVDQYPGDRNVIDQIARNIGGRAWYLFFDIFGEIFRHNRFKSVLRDPDETERKIREALQRENTAYTFVEGYFVERMTGVEVQAIETSLRSPIEGIREHFTTALKFLSDRDSPDYRNSIKESILAVEAACNHVAHQEKATVESALNTLHKRRPLHPAFIDALSKLYAWKNDEGGIRHALLETDKLEGEDAQFMLVTCSGFVNYLLDC